MLLIALLLGLSMAFAWASLDLSAHGKVSLWWPASGVNVVAAIAIGRKHRWAVLLLIAVLTIPVTLHFGRPVLVAVIASLSVAFEAWVVTRFSVDRDDQPRLRTTTDVIRFFCGVLIGVVVSGGVSAVVISLVSGGDPASVMLSVMASHASAIIVIAPIALVNRMKRATARPWVLVLHSCLLAASIGVSFAPGSTAPLAFLPIPFLAWAAFSFSMSVALSQLIGSSVLVVILAGLGGGRFSAAEITWLSPAALLELYVITLSITTLLIAAARNERQMLEEEKGATAQLLHRGFEASQNGFAIVQHVDGQFSVMESNTAASVLMPLSLSPAGELIPDSPVFRVLASMLADEVDAVTIDSNGDDGSGVPATLSVTRVTNSTFGDILLISVLDLRPVRAAEEAARLQLEREAFVIEELRGLNQQKDDFVSSVTHELRTPITTVIGFSEELDDTPLDSTQKGYVAIIQRNAERLLSVVEDVLTFSRRKPGSIHTASHTEVDLTEAVTLVLDDLRHSVRSKSIEVVVDLPTDPITVIGDPNDLTRVLINLLTNAVKFTPIEGKLVVVASLAHDTATVTITDNGPGVALADLDRVFDRFYRSSRASHDGVPGTGLGLSIVRELVTEMNGTVTLESDGEHGTTARITLPAVVTAPAEVIG